MDRLLVVLWGVAATPVTRLPLRRRGPAGGGRRRLAVGGRAPLATCRDTIFYTDALLGTPGKAVQLLVDTGSADLWVAASDCASCDTSDA